MSGASIRPKTKGLAKAKLRRAFTLERTTRARSEDGFWRDLFKSADVVSEGAVQAASASYFGMTDIVVPFPSDFGTSERAAHIAVARACVHVKLRALRVARREAQSRANVDLDASHCEIVFSEERTNLRIHVELSAKVLHKNSRGLSRTVRKLQGR